jgi:hypothetical protein
MHDSRLIAGSEHHQLRLARKWGVVSVFLAMIVAPSGAYPRSLEADQNETRPTAAPNAEPQDPIKRISVSISGFFAQRTDITISGNGRGAVTIVDVRGGQSKNYEAKIQLSDQHMQQLKEYLKRTDWLGRPVDEPRYIHVVWYEFKLVREGRTLRARCHGRSPEPYEALVGFMRRLSAQEGLLYRLINPKARLSAWREIAAQLRRIEHGPAIPEPYEVLDYHRFVPEAKAVVAKPNGRPRDEIETAIKLLGLLKVESEWDRIAALASTAPKAVANALVRFGRRQAIDVFTRMLQERSSVGAWGLIRLGPIAVPAIAEIIQRPPDPNDTSHVALVRSYIDHWNELPGGLDERVIKAVRKKRKMPGHRTEYYKQFLKMVETEPPIAGPIVSRISQSGANFGEEQHSISWKITRREPVHLVYGWYTVSDGKITEHGGGGAIPRGTAPIDLRIYASTEGNVLQLKSEQKERRVDAPTNRQVNVISEIVRPPRAALKTVYHLPKPAKLTGRYLTLWEGQLIEGDAVLNTVVYAARILESAQPDEEFEPPSEFALIFEKKVEKREKLSFRRFDLSNSRLTNDVEKLSLLFEEHPKGSGAHRLHEEVVVAFRSKLKDEAGYHGAVYYIPRRKLFYVQYDEPRPNPIQYFGPFHGDPYELLYLPRPAAADTPSIELVELHGSDRGNAIEMIGDADMFRAEWEKRSREEEGKIHGLRGSRDVIERYEAIAKAYPRTKFAGMSLNIVMGVQALTGDLPTSSATYERTRKSFRGTQYEFDAHMSMGLIHLQNLKQPAKAAEYFERMPDPRKVGSHDLSEAESYFFNARLQLAKCYLQMGKAEDARREKEDLIARYPERKKTVRAVIRAAHAELKNVRDAG